MELTFYRRFNLVYLDVVITPNDLYTADLPLKVSLLTPDDGADYRRPLPGAITYIPLLQSFLQIAFFHPINKLAIVICLKKSYLPRQLTDIDIIAVLDEVNMKQLESFDVKWNSPLH